jgi:hypothetical protein
MQGWGWERVPIAGMVVRMDLWVPCHALTGSDPCTFAGRPIMWRHIYAHRYWVAFLAGVTAWSWWQYGWQPALVVAGFVGACYLIERIARR